MHHDVEQTTNHLDVVLLVHHLGFWLWQLGVGALGLGYAHLALVVPSLYYVPHLTHH